MECDLGSMEAALLIFEEYVLNSLQLLHPISVLILDDLNDCELLVLAGLDLIDLRFYHIKFKQCLRTLD
jgi:hypothetical protein